MASTRNERVSLCSLRWLRVCVYIWWFVFISTIDEMKEAKNNMFYMKVFDMNAFWIPSQTFLFIYSWLWSAYSAAATMTWNEQRWKRKKIQHRIDKNTLPSYKNALDIFDNLYLRIAIRMCGTHTHTHRHVQEWNVWPKQRIRKKSKEDQIYKTKMMCNAINWLLCPMSLCPSNI